MNFLVLSALILSIFSTCSAIIGAQDYVAPSSNSTRISRQSPLEDVLKLKDAGKEGEEEDVGPLGEVQLDVAEEDLEPARKRVRRGYGGGGQQQQQPKGKYGGGGGQQGVSKYGGGSSKYGSSQGGGQQSGYGQQNSGGQSKYGGGQQQEQQQQQQQQQYY